MIIFIYGTTGELIKIAPLLSKLPRDQYILVNTVQQARQLPKLQRQLSITDDFVLANGYRGRDLEKYFQVLIWLPTVIFYFFIKRKRIKRIVKNSSYSRSIVLVHGDTNTTIIGSILGKLLGLKVGHIEAGLRSFNLLHPFPEEINRRIVTKFARVHFAPGDQPVKNLAKAKGEVVNTFYNTVKDSIDLVKDIKSITLPKDLPKNYGIVSIHRNELLSNKNALEDLLRCLGSKEIASKNLIYLDHPITQERIRALGFGHYLKRENIIRIPKLDYPSFMKLLGNSSFVITDSGGLQEECTYLNIPCVVHRKVTERLEGLGSNVELTGMNSEAVVPILEKLLKHRAGRQAEKNDSPTQAIINYLRINNYI